ncbi:MAG: hypothetical protein IPJ17_08530 [Holophagales bacterium]|nr:MAG: hypothetical protein IPJ17_08530 [Holophagales bacterium]
MTLFEKLVLSANRVALLLGGAFGLVFVAASRVLGQPLQRGVLLLGLFGVLALVCEVTRSGNAQLSLQSGLCADAVGSLVLLLPRAAVATLESGEWLGRTCGAAILLVLAAILQLRLSMTARLPKDGE